MSAKEKGASDRAERPVRKLMQCLDKGGGPKQRQESAEESLNSGRADSRACDPKAMFVSVSFCCCLTNIPKIWWLKTIAIYVMILSLS